MAKTKTIEVGGRKFDLEVTPPDMQNRDSWVIAIKERGSGPKMTEKELLERAEKLVNEGALRQPSKKLIRQIVPVMGQ